MTLRLGCIPCRAVHPSTGWRLVNDVISGKCPDCGSVTIGVLECDECGDTLRTARVDGWTFELGDGVRHVCGKCS